MAEEGQDQTYTSSAVIPVAPMTIKDGKTYNRGVYDCLHMFALCMDYDSSQLQIQPWRLYNQMARQGFKQRGLYEIQMPHLVRIIRDDSRPEKPGAPQCFTPFPEATSKDEALMIWARPNTRLRTGLYVCSLELKLSNPHWRLEDAEYDFATRQWILDDVYRRIPPNQPSDCEAQFFLHVLRYTGPLPAPPSSSPTWTSWFPVEQFERIRGEFQKYFLESG